MTRKDDVDIRTIRPGRPAGAPPVPTRNPAEHPQTRHVIKEGSRQHVLSWHGGIRDGRWTSWSICSEPRCEINREANR